jgi:hypothetical protein
MHPSMQDQLCQIWLLHAQTMVLMVDMSHRIMIKTRGAVGKTMLPVAIVPSQSFGEVLAKYAPSALTGLRETSERVSYAASVTCMRQAHPRLTSAHWVEERVAKPTFRSSFIAGHMRAQIPLIGPILCLSAQAAVAFQRYRFNNGLVLGATLAAVSCYDDRARRMGLRPSQMQLTLIAAAAAALTMIVQQVLRACVDF